MILCIPSVTIVPDVGMAPLVAVTLALALFVTVQAAPTPSCEDDSIWKSGSSYQYAYLATVEGAAPGTTDRVTGVQIKCNVNLHAPGQCRYSLKLSDCSLSEIQSPGKQHQYKPHPRNAEFKEHLAKSPVTFSMSHGQVHSISASSNEPIGVLNLKRGIISTFLVKNEDTADDDFEMRTDVHGICPVHYTGGKDHVEFEKKMNECRYPGRVDWHLSPYSLAWNLSFVQFWMINGSSHCSYDLAGQGVKKIVCDERHAMRFESKLNTELAVQTVVHQTLEQKGVKADTSYPQPKNPKTKGILYEWEATPRPTQMPPDFLNKAKKIMADLVTTSTTEMKTYTIPQFDKLVSLLRQSPDVVPFTQAVIKCQFKSGCSDIEKELSLSYLRDALVTCNSAACMKGVRILVTSDNMSKNYFNVMLYSFTKLKVTEEEYLTEVLEMCKYKKTRFCLLTLTSMIHTYSTKHGHHHMPKAVKETVDILTKMIGENCNPSAVLAELNHYDRIEVIILALKSIGNLGNCAQHASNTIGRRLGRCMANKDVPHNVTLEAIKALRRMDAVPQMYQPLLSFVQNQKEAMEIRVVAYIVLTKLFPEPKLYEDLAKILKTEKSHQLGNFVTMHMNNVLTHPDASIEELQKSIRTVMPDHEDVFVVQGTHPLTSSRHRQISRFWSSPIIQDAINRFGIDISSSAIYETYSYLPQQLIFNLTTQLFGKTFNPTTLSAGLHGLEPVIEALFGPNGVLRTGRLKEGLAKLGARGVGILQYLEDPVAFADKSWTPHFNNDVEQKLDKLHNSVFMQYGHIPSFASFSVQLYGDELGFTSLDLIKNRILEFMDHDFHEINWEDYLHYRAHRVIRFLEGSSQVPTMVGLPLYWKSDASLAISFRAKGKCDPFQLMLTEPELNAEWDLSASGALTVRNRMVVKVPHFTKFGFQANTTLYRTRDRSGELAYKKGDLHLRINVPTRPQQIINLFRVNELIRGDAHESLPDHGVKRVDKEFCHPGQYTGLKYCRKKSYADVIGDDTKPFVLLAGNAEYRVWYEKDDADLKYYDLHVTRDSSRLPQRTTTILFKAPGTKLRREVKAVVKRNLDTKEFSVQVTVPERPHFRFSGERKLKKEGGKNVGYVTHLDAMFVEGRPVTFHGESRHTTESKLNKINQKSVSTDVKELSLKLTVKHRKYSYVRKLSTSDTVKELDAAATYESDSADSYMHDILPDSFWETDRKAKFNLHVSVNKQLDEADWQRQIEAYIALPKSILKVDTNHVEKANERHIIHLNVTRMTHPAREVQSFFYFNYDMWNKVQGEKTKRSHLVKLMIPKVRWQVEIKREIDPIDNKNYAILKREKALDNSMVVTDASKVKEFHVTLNIDHHNASRARGENYPMPRERHLNVKLTYPHDGTYYTVTYNGKIINDEAQKNAIRSFHTDSNIESQRLQLKIHANTDYLRTATNLKLTHKSDYTYAPTGKTATYKVNVDLDRQKPKFEVDQTFDSSFYTFEEKASIVKTGNNIDGKLTIKANSPVWDALNVDLEQVVKVDLEGDSWETMKLRHKLFDIDVRADFKLPFGRYYKKTFIIKSKNAILPNMNWYIYNHDYKYYSFHIEYPDDHRNVYAVLETDPNAKGGELTVKHDGSGEGNTTVIDWVIRIVKPDVILANFNTDRQAIKRAVLVWKERYSKAWQAWVEIKNDPNHPMNKLLKPIVKTTLADYQKNCLERIQQRRMAIRAALVEAVESLEPIYGPARDVLKGIALSIERLWFHLIQQDPETYQSILVRVWNRLNLHERLRSLSRRIALRIAMRLNYISSTRDGGIVIHHPFRLTSFAELPTPTPALHRRIQRVRRIKAFFQKKVEFRRYGAGYGISHLATFDGKLYDFPGFVNKDCMYLMAHDFVFRRYTVLAQELSIHILFPELAITVDRQSNVYLNGSKTAINLPVRSYNDLVHVEKNKGFITITSRYGLNVDLNPAENVGFFSLDFWNHNRTLGLLGNNDNEVMNDFRMLNGKTANNALEFVSSYELSGQKACKDPKQMSLQKYCKAPIDGSPCDDVFSKKNFRSPFYACFDLIDPTTFQENCHKEAKCGGSSCSSMMAYKQLCESIHVYLNLPAHCY